MVPAGEPTEEMVPSSLGEPARRATRSSTAATPISRTTCAARAAAGARKGSYYVDAGTSGGVWGLERGYCLMIGGERTDGRAARSDLEDAGAADAATSPRPPPGREGKQSTAEEGYLHCGPAGAGHFVKMIHNGIEYGLMQAYAEGFDIFRNATSKALPEEHRFDLDLADIAEVWRRGSVVTSWLLDLTAQRARREPRALRVHRLRRRTRAKGAGRSSAAHRGGGARATCSPPRSSTASARARSTRSREKMLSAMRHKFGGHVEKHPQTSREQKEEHDGDAERSRVGEPAPAPPA